MRVQLQIMLPDGRWEVLCNRTFPNMDDAVEWYSSVESIESKFKTRLVPRQSSHWISGITIWERTWEIVNKSKRP
jgi:hypothetical protein